MKPITRKLILIASLLFLFQLLLQPVLANEQILVEYFYSGSCGSCKKYSDLVEEVEQNYSNEPVYVQWRDITKGDNRTAWNDYNFTYISLCRGKW